MKAIRSQQGMSLIGTLILLAAAALLVVAGLRLGPHYLDYWALKKAMDKAGSDPSAKVEDADDYFQYLTRTAQVNDIRNLDLRKALSITQQSGGLMAHLAYERREHLLGNIDLVVNFDHQAGVRAP